jgi:hypothetical protein
LTYAIQLLLAWSQSAIFPKGLSSFRSKAILGAGRRSLTSRPLVT